MSYTSEHPAWTATCAVCNGPVDLKTCQADENGKPVHEECYAHKIQPPQAAPQFLHRRVRLPSFLGHYRVRM
jgi:hypothetical protein